MIYNCFLIINYTVYLISVPHVARTKTWKSCEANEIIFVWHHAEELEPHWQPQTNSHVSNRTWRYHGRNEFLINCHIQVNLINLYINFIFRITRRVDVDKIFCFSKIQSLNSPKYASVKRNNLEIIKIRAI